MTVVFGVHSLLLLVTPTNAQCRVWRQRNDKNGIGYFTALCRIWQGQGNALTKGRLPVPDTSASPPLEHRAVYVNALWLRA